jgi:hypothetical protein
MMNKPNERTAPIAWVPGRFMLPGDDVSLCALHLKPAYFHAAIRETDALVRRMTRGK